MSTDPDEKSHAGRWNRFHLPLRAWLPLAVLLAVLLALRFWPGAFGLDPGAASSIPVAGGDFVLQDSTGTWRFSEAMRGRDLAIVYFGFTHCPDVCPTTLSNVRRALSKVPDAAARVLTVFVSVDHRSDRPADVARYAHYFGDGVVGVTGDSAAIERVCRQYDVYHAFSPLPGSAMGYTVDHTTQVYLVRADGSVADHFTLERVGADASARIRGALGRARASR